eukprot:gene3748-13808_t
MSMTDFTSNVSMHKDAGILSWDKRKRALHEEAVQLQAEHEEANTDFTFDESMHKDAGILSWDKRKRALHEEAVLLVKSMPEFTPDA